jgi:RHS repeat-associated protein
MMHSYDGDGLRVKKTESGAATYLLRSSVLGGQVVAEIVWASGSWQWNRGYVYLGSQLLAVQQAGVYWMHEDPVTKSKRVTNSAGAVVSTIELDPWGAGTNRNLNSAFQSRTFTSYTHDADGGDDAMMRRYGSYWSRFSQPDPYDGSYELGNPQSFNRYAYVNGDPVNFVDPTGLKQCIPGDISPECDSSGFGGWGGGYAGGNGWGNNPNPGRDIVAAGFNSDVRELWLVWDAEMCDLTSGRAGCKDITEARSGLGSQFFGFQQNRGNKKLSAKDLQEVKRRVDAGNAWQKWQDWFNCNEQIKAKYKSQRENYLREARSVEVAVSIVGLLGTLFGFSGASGLSVGPLVPVGQIVNERAKINEINANYKDERDRVCGPEVSKPAGHN